jgi:hypothetical protein
MKQYVCIKALIYLKFTKVPFFLSFSYIMGCCNSSEVNSEKAILKLRDQEIEEQLKKDRQKMAREVKLLLLGNV